MRIEYLLVLFIHLSDIEFSAYLRSLKIGLLFVYLFENQDINLLKDASLEELEQILPKKVALALYNKLHYGI